MPHNGPLIIHNLKCVSLVRRSDVDFLNSFVLPDKRDERDSL